MSSDVAAPSKPAAFTDFFVSHEGTAAAIPPGRRERARLRWHDFLCEARVRLGSGLRRARAAGRGRKERVLLVGIEVPSRANDIHGAMARLEKGSRHDVTVAVAPMLERGKFDNIESAIALAPAPLESYDWLVITDDDIAFRRGFLDDLIAIASAADLALSQPCHALLSHTTYEITRRRYGVLARHTRFVEIGPLTLVRADLFASLVPFPPSRWCYGIDLVWSVAARQAGRKIGIVDGVAVRHLRPVAATYDMDAARAEGQDLVVAHSITETRAEFFGLDEVVLAA